MKIQKNQNEFSNYCVLHDLDFFEKQKVAGKCVSECLKRAGNMISVEKNLSGKNIEEECLKIMKEHDCTPTFLNYSTDLSKKPFPGAICVSVNKELVHGCPKKENFKSGDIVKIDLGATYQGAIADAARSFIFGEPKSIQQETMLKVCYNALLNAIEQIQIGKRIGVIGHAISRIAKNEGFRVVTELGGHGITWNTPHAFPFVANRSAIHEGIRFQNGMTIAIEPLVTFGDIKIKLENDGWTVTLPNESAHFEDTIFILDNQIHVMTN